MPLTDVKVRAAKPAAKGYRLADAGGLHLFVTPTGVKSWRWRHEAGGRERTVVLGRYPAMGLADARFARDDARAQMRAGPAASKAPTLKVAAEEWHALNKPRWKPHHAADVLAGLVAEVFPSLGATPVNRIGSPDVLAVLRPLEHRGAVDTSKRIKQRLVAVFGYAISQGWVTLNPAVGIDNALAPMPDKGHRPAVETLDAARAALAAVEALSGQPSSKLAHRLLALTAARPGEVGGLQWSELHDLDGAEPTWRIPAARMKMKREHVIPLAPAAVEALLAARKLSGHTALAFPNLWNVAKPLSVTALSHLLLRAGYRDRHVPHGWRATFSTVMNERYPNDRAVIDLMLAHMPKDAVERAYNRAAHAVRRRELAGLWANMLMKGALPAAALLAMSRRT